ncbi:MAG: hypothetical protein WCB02_41185, partial [Bradyrhizobium sp.]
MSSVIDLRSYVGASNSRLLVIVDLQEQNYHELSRDPLSDVERSLQNCMFAIRHARDRGLPIAFARQSFASEWCETAPCSGWISGFEPRR